MKREIEILNRLAYRKVIKQDQITSIVEQWEKSNLSLFDFLKSKNLCEETQYYNALADIYQIPYIELERLEIDKKYLEQFNLAFLRKHKIIPVKIADSGVLVVAIGDYSNIMSRSAIASYFDGKIEYIQVTPKQIDLFIDSILAVKKTANALSALEKEKGTQKQDANFEDEKEEEVINAPAVRLVDSIIKEAIPFRASDIHIEPYENEVKVRYRIDGDLSDRAEFPIQSYAAVTARLKIISGMNIAERRIPQDGRINMEINGVEYDFRVSTLPTVHGEKFVIRVLDKSSFNFSRKDLGFTIQENKIVDKILAHPHGIVLLTGPTGCGKSTTLYSFLKEVNKPNVNIVTVEDPVEYTMQGINQTQVNVKANMTFATALRSILRQDPDIIMIGEIRDEETAQIGIRAAITGHLVFSTLHTNDAPGAVTRLIDMGVSSYLVGDSVVGVISQRLVKKLCPMCKRKLLTNEKEMNLLGIDSPQEIYHAEGCQFCNGSGYKGRLAVHEIMYINDSIRSLINQNAPVEKLREVAMQTGMISLEQSCQNAVLNGETSLQEYLSLNVIED